MNRMTFFIPPHLQFSNYIAPPDNVKVVKKADGKFYGNLITDMPLGPLAISSYLKKHIPGFQTKLVDFNIELNELAAFPHASFEDYFAAYFREHSAEFADTEIFGISCLFSPSYLSFIELAREVKRRFPKATVMAGGNIPTNMYREIFRMEPDAIDYICYGEAELPLLHFLQAKDRDAYVAQSASWVTSEKAQLTDFHPKHDFINNLDEIPIYDFDLCGSRYSQNPTYTAYGSHQDKESNFHILTSRGCPFHCIFCASHKVHGRVMRYYSLDRVKEDLLCLKEKGAKTILFQDDHFMGDPKRALEIVKFVGQLGFKFIFQNSLALYALKREFLEAARSAGMDQLVLAVESGSERVLRQVMKKPLNLEIVERVVKDCRELGIYTFCNIVMGLPGETKEDIEDARKFLKSIYANWFGIYIANPLVGSEMFEICSDRGYLHENWIGSDYKQAVVSTGDWTSEYIKNKAYQFNLELNIVENSDFRLGNYRLALEAFERVIGAKESHAIAYYMAAQCLFRLQDEPKALTYLQKAQRHYQTEEFWKRHMDGFGIDPFAPLILPKPDESTESAGPEMKAKKPTRHFTNY